MPVQEVDKGGRSYAVPRAVQQRQPAARAQDLVDAAQGHGRPIRRSRCPVAAGR
jgi:hypothetical protein